MKNKILLATAMTLLASPAWATVINERQLVASETSQSFDGDTFTVETTTASEGGAIYNLGTLSVDNSVFQNNVLNKVGNHNSGGAIYNRGNAIIRDSQFINTRLETDGTNTALGGAVHNASGGTVIIENSLFSNNTVKSGKPRGGAIWNTASMTITGSTFQKNQTLQNIEGSWDMMASAVYHTTGVLTLNNNLFGGENASFANLGNSTVVSNGGTINFSGNTFKYNNAHVEGIVDFQGSSAKGIFTDTNTFESNTGTGLYNWAGGAVIFKSGSTTNFISNTALTDGNPKGGAIYNSETMTFESGSVANFTNNSARVGGAIYNSGNLTLAGTSTFSGNKAGDDLNDIHNTGSINVLGDLTLDGGVSGDGTMTFASGSNLFVKTGTTTISNEVINQGATLNLSFDNGFTGTYTLITDAGSLDTEFTIADNALYDVKSVSNGVYEVSKKSAAIIAEETNATQNQANTIAAVTSGDSDNATFNAIADNLNEMIQSGDAVAIQMALEAAETLAPEVAPVVMQTTSDNTNQIFSAVSTRMSGGAAAPTSKGLASGDAFFEQGAAWVQTLYNHAELENTRQARGYEADSKGLAFGFEKQINYAVKAGIGYAYTQTDIDSKNRSTDVDTHTAIVYGEYRPSAWFVNGMASYSWSDYDEEKMILFNKVKSDYKAESYALQAMTGVELMAQNTVFTPEAGLRYVHVFQDGYKDTAGQYVYGAEIDALTGIAGLRMEQAYEMENDWVLRPSARFAVTYDIVNDNNNSAVALANGSTYNITGEPLKRFGMEADFSLTAEVSDNVSVSLGYQGKFRDHYEDHTGMLNFRYEF